jgi:hypothetical protein
LPQPVNRETQTIASKEIIALTLSETKLEGLLIQ